MGMISTKNNVRLLSLTSLEDVVNAIEKLAAAPSYISLPPSRVYNNNNKKKTSRTTTKTININKNKTKKNWPAINS